MSQMQVIIKKENEDFTSKLSFQKGESLLSLCQKAGIAMTAPCGGKGICGKCKVRFLSGAPLPQPAERSKLSPDELRQGIRLACVTKLTDNCQVLLPGQKNPDVITGRFEINWENGKKGCFLSVDIGTTTLVMEKRNKSDGKIIAVYKAVNAQRAYGADVLSRMEAALDGKSENLAKAIQKQLEEGAQQLNAEAPLADFMVIAANTTMVHLLMQYDVSGLARAPFRPVNLGEIITEIAGMKTYILPGISAFVGGDIAAGLYAIEAVKDREKGEESFRLPDEKWNLLIDLGTNAELVLYKQSQGICCATAAGPAFDGDAGTGIFGSDMIAILSDLRTKGIVDENGTLEEAYFESGVDIPFSESVLHISQDQIRSLQLAKAAVRTGIEALMQRENITAKQIDRVYLAGGFGYYLDVHAAVKTGLLPSQLEDKAIACGNTSLLGAAVYAHKLLENEERNLPIHLQAINLAEEPFFKENYVNHINFA